tara:strand:+ start:1335 stop:2279 length:945 start_codon:yes stop_codon:yes gene_type:complete
MSAGKSKTSERAVVPDYLQDLYTKASEIGLESADLDFQPYAGQMVAGLTPDQIKAMTTTRSIFDQSMGFDPRSAISGLINRESPNVESASLMDGLSTYQSRLEDDVINSYLADANRQRDLLESRAQDRAIKAGAFGGSRSALLESEATRPLDEITSQTIAGLRLKGFQDAAMLADRDAQRRQQANNLTSQLGLRQMGLQANLLGGQLADQYRNLGLLSSIGEQQRQIDQANLLADRDEFDRELDFPLRRLGLLGAASGQISPSVIGRDSKTKSFELDAMDVFKGMTGLGSLGMGPLGGVSTDALAQMSSGIFGP